MATDWTSRIQRFLINAPGKVNAAMGGFSVSPKILPQPGENVPRYVGRQVREKAIAAVKPITDRFSSAGDAAGSFMAGVSGEPNPNVDDGSHDALVRTGAKKASGVNAPAQNLSPPATPTPTAVSDPYGTVRIGGAPDAPGRSYTVEGVNGAAWGMRSNPSRGGGGFVGAGTDEEAGRAMQARAAQMQNAQVNIAQMNTAADAQRDLRAAKLGVSRGMLDQMEGRAGPSADARVTVVGRDPTEGTVFSDTPNPTAQINAARGFGARRKNDRALEVYQTQMQSADRANEIAAQMLGNQQSAAATMGAAQLNAQARQMQEAGLDRRALQSEAGQDRRAQLTSNTTLATKAADLGEKKDDNLANQFKEGNAVWAEATKDNPKTGYSDLSYADFTAWAKQTNPATLGQALGVSEQTAKRLLAGQHTADEARTIVGKVKAWKDAVNNQGFFARHFNDPPSTL